MKISNDDLNNFEEKSILVRADNKYILKTGKKEIYQTYCKSSMPIYLFKEAKTWFGNFKFVNEFKKDSPIVYNYVDEKKGQGQICGEKIVSTCYFEVNTEAKKAFLELFDGKNGSSLSDISIFAEQLKQAAIENNDFNLKLTYYGLCKMMEDEKGYNIVLDEEIKNEIEKNEIQNDGKIEIDIHAIPSYIYNVLVASAIIPDFEIQNNFALGITSSISYKSDILFNKYTMPYGANYKTNFPTRTVNLYSDLNVPSGLTLEEFYKIAEFYAKKRYSNLVKKGTLEDNMKFCYELAEASYYIEQDIGINGLYMLGASALEGGWGASFWSVTRGNLWGYQIHGNQIGLDYNNSSTKMPLKEIDLTRYKSPHQRCEYIVATYLKCLYITDYNDISQYIENLPGKDDTEKCLKLKYYNMTDKEFEDFLIDNHVDTNVEQLFRVYRNWNDGRKIGHFYSCYGPSIYSIDGIYNRGWRYEYKGYGQEIYQIMEMIYNAAIKGESIDDVNVS